jgi:hypothetical protein
MNQVYLRYFALGFSTGRLLVVALVSWLALSASVLAQDTTFISNNGALPRQGAVSSNQFTLSATTTLVLRVVADYSADAGIFTASSFTAFSNGQAASGWALFNAKIGTTTVTLNPGSYVVAIRNGTNGANNFAYELDYDENRPGQRRLDSQGAAEYVGANGGKLWQPFTIGSGQYVWIDGANVGLEFYLLPAAELDNFKAGRPFRSFADYEPVVQASQPGAFHVDLPPGDYVLAFRNPTPISKPVTYTIEWWSGGSIVVTPPVAIPPSISNQPASQTVSAGQSASFSVTAIGSASLTYQWRKNGTAISGAVAATYSIASATAADAAGYSATVSNSAGSVTSNTATLTVTAAPVTPPAGTTGATGTRATAASVALNTTASGRIATGGEVNYFRVTVTAAGTLTVATTGSTDTIGELQDATGTVLASDDDNGAASNFSITRVVGIGTYFVAVRTFSAAATGSYGLGVAFTATPGTVVPPVGPSTPASRLANLSVRTSLARAQTLIVGFTVSGGSKPILVRAAGPALGALGLTGFLPDPGLELYKDSALLKSNDDWASTLAPTFASVGAFAFSAGSVDAAFLENLSGGYSAWARSVTAAGTGTVLVEAYDAGSGSAVRLTNLSARNRVGTGNDILIAGFFIAGTGTQRVLIRAVGPSLAAFGLTGLLTDPKLEIYNAAGAKIAENDNWDATLSSTFASAGAFALTPGGKDAALIVSLPAGATYTVQVKGADGGTGEGLIEVYELP